MINRTATLLSLAGVLVAGSAAALVNSQVLQGSSGASADPSALIVPPPSTVPATTVTAVPVTTPLPADTVAATQPVAAATYAVGDSGVVALDGSTGALALVSAVPNPGWEVVATGPNGLGGIGVVFRSPTVDVTFNAVLTDGQIVTSVGAAAIDTTGTSVEDSTGTSLDDHGGDDNSDDDGDDSSGRGRGRGGDDDD